MKINERKRTFGADCYIFKGMLRCAECNFVLGGKFYKNNIETSKYYYICRNHHMKKKCSCSKNFNEYLIEKKLLENIDIYILDYLKDCEKKEKEVSINDNEKEKKQINKQLEKLRDLYLRDLIQIEHYEKQYKELSLKLEELNCNQIEPPKKHNLNDLKRFLNSDFKLIYVKLSRLEKRRIWASIIDTIYIDKDYNIKIVFI